MKNFKILQSIVVEIGDGYRVMLQDHVDDTETLFFYLCHEKYATWMFCFGMPRVMIAEQSAEEIVNTFIEQADYFIEDYKNKIEKQSNT